MLNNLDRKTIGRWPARVREDDNDYFPRDKKSEDPFFLFFDGNSFKSYNSRSGSSADPFTGYGMTAAMLRPGKLTQTDWDYARAYVLCEYAFRCIEMVASDVAAIKHGVRNRQTKEDMPDHPLMKAIAWARKVNSQDILSLWEKSLYIWGETYLLPIANGFNNLETGRPFYSGLQWLNPLVTEPYIPQNRLEGFEYSAYGMNRFHRSEIVYDKVGSIFDDIRGQSRISVVLAAENIDIEIKRFRLDSLLKDMRFQGILTGRQGSSISQGELDAAVETLKKQRESRLVALAAALEFTKVQNDSTDAQTEATEDARRRITVGLGVPMSVVGAWDDAKYQSAPAQLAFYYDHVIFRELDRLALVVGEQLMPYYDPWGEGEWYYDKDSVMTLIEDKVAKTGMYNSQLTAGGITQNEWRKALGYKEEPNGNVYFIPAGTIIVPKEGILEFASRQAQQIAAMPTAMPAFAPMANDAMASLPAPASVPGGKSICLMLALPNNADLIDLQKKVSKLYGETPVQWNAPAEFHITLLYAPSVTDEQIAAICEALDDVDVPELSLNIGSLYIMKNPGENAVVFRIRRNADLYDYQELLHEMFTQLGISMSSYSLPAEYQPHVTMGYSVQPVQGATYKTKLRVKPTALRLMDGDEVLYERAPGQDADEEPEAEPEQPATKAALVWQAEAQYTVTSPNPAQHCSNCRWFSDQPNTTPCNIVINAPLTIVPDGWCKRWEIIPHGSTVNTWVEDYNVGNPNLVPELIPPDVAAELAEIGETASPAAAYLYTPEDVDELRAWRKKALNNGAIKARTFVSYKLPETVQGFIRDGLTDDLDADGVKSLFGHVEDAIKAQADDALPMSEGTFVELVNLWNKLGIPGLVEEVNEAADGDQSGTD